MNIEELIQPFKTFYSSNTELAIGIIAAVAIAVLIKPKEIGKILVAIGIIATIGYLIASLGNVVSNSVDNKSEVGTKTDKLYRDKEQ